MTRHGKNATASAVYSYSERKKDAKESGYGTLHQRLGADSVKPFDCCSITLQPCRDPVISPHGYIFDREAVLEYYLEQKKEIAYRMKEWEKYCRREEEEVEREKKEIQEKKLENFRLAVGMPSLCRRKADMDLEPTTSAGATPSGVKTSKRKADTSGEEYGKRAKEEGLSNVSGDKFKEYPSFWIPQLNPTAAAKIEKPNHRVLCPISGKPLKIKELMPVKFTLMPDDGKKSIIARDVRYMCPVTHDALTNAVRCAYLKTSQSIVTMECVEKIIKKEMIDPLNGKPITDDDIIELQRGGTGFALTNKVQAKLVRPQLELQ